MLPTPKNRTDVPGKVNPTSDPRIYIVNVDTMPLCIPPHSLLSLVSEPEVQTLVAQVFGVLEIVCLLLERATTGQVSDSYAKYPTVNTNLWRHGSPDGFSSPIDGSVEEEREDVETDVEHCGRTHEMESGNRRLRGGTHHRQRSTQCCRVCLDGENIVSSGRRRE